MNKNKDNTHSHDWMIKDERRYRDEDRNEYMMDIYVCECGAGSMIKTPMDLFNKGLRLMKLELLPDELVPKERKK